MNHRLFLLVWIGLAQITAPAPFNRFRFSEQGREVTSGGLFCNWLSATFVEGSTVWRFPCGDEGAGAPVILHWIS
jgi:hypothetical protein